ncbi:MAG: DASH family cryptochrome [Rheinheimera sp.]
MPQQTQNQPDQAAASEPLLPGNTVLYWFRNDLRLSDNPALVRACQQATQQQASMALVVCLPITADTRWGFPRLSAHRKVYLAQTIAELAAQCALLGQRLIIVEGDAATVLPPLLQALQATRLYCEEIAAPEEMAELASLQRQGVLVNGFQIDQRWQSSLLEPAALPFPISELPLVFTAFRNQIEKANTVPLAPLPKITQFPNMPATATKIVNVDLQTWAGEAQADPRSAFCYQQAHASAGESAAQLHLLRYFQSGKARNYKETRNGLIGFDYSTKFSPWLACGAISARQIYHELKVHEAEYDQNDSTYWIWFELLWRDYFRFLHQRFGKQLYHSQGLKNPGAGSEQYNLPPRRSRTGLTKNSLPGVTTTRPKSSATVIPHYPELFNQWCQGETGQTLVDAGMRELKATGYLSNRMRQIVASYLVNDLQCDWRAGAAWFEAQLIDYDVYSNQGNWLYLAGPLWQDSCHYLKFNQLGR